MASNPNPARITDPEWRLWEECLLVIPGVRLGGIYANKSGYHNTVAANLVGWPGNYSTRLPLDLNYDPRDKARAIDLTMNATEMSRRTGWLRDAAIHADDDRVGCVREFYGTLDGRVVFGRSHDTETSAWRSATSDASHLWHIHISFFTRYCDDWAAAPGVYGLEGVLSVLSGEFWDAWVARKSGSQPTPGDDDMTQDEHDLLVAAAWRQDAAASGSLTIQGGPFIGQPYALNVTLKAITDELARLSAKVDAITVGTGASAAEVRTIVDEELDEAFRGAADANS